MLIGPSRSFERVSKDGRDPRCCRLALGAHILSTLLVNATITTVAERRGAALSSSVRHARPARRS
jgi:hypothetical protein